MLVPMYERTKEQSLTGNKAVVINSPQG